MSKRVENEAPLGEAAPPSGGGISAPEADRAAHVARVERLFREHNASLLGFLRARLHSAQEAREIAQEAYVRLLDLDNPNAVSYLRAYLFRTAANLATNRLQQRSSREQIDTLVFFEPEPVGAPPERQLTAEQELALIRQALEELPPKCRMAFILYQLHDLTLEETAKRMSLQTRMVKRYVARALAHCKRVMDEQSQAQRRSG